MKSAKQFLIKSIASILVILLILSTIVIVVDPFMHYHAPLFGLAPVASYQRGAVPGAARQLDYETALIGSSMSENFKASWFEDGYFGDKCVKLPLEGAHFADYDLLFREAIKKESLKNIVFSLDNYLLTDAPSESEQTIPEYLSNRNPFDDVYYLLNRSVLLEYLPRFLATNVKEHYNADNAYVWSNDYAFSYEIATGTYLPQRTPAPQPMLEYDAFFESTDLFLEQITPYIEAREDVTFYFYVPPYSFMFWDNSVRTGHLTAEICAMERAYSKLLTYDNVRLFYYQNDFELITDLSHYRDYSHFDQSVNHMMYESMRNGTQELTLDNYYDALLQMDEFAKTFDFDGALGF